MIQNLEMRETIQQYQYSFAKGLFHGNQLQVFCLLCQIVHHVY